MNAIKSKRCCNSHEEIKIASRHMKSSRLWKQGDVSQKWLWRDADNVLFQYLGYSIHFTLISFSFIIEGSLVLYIPPRCIPYHTQHYYCCCLNYILSGACVFFLLSFHIQCCLFFLVRLVIFRWNIIARIFSVLWEFHTLS